MCNSSSITILLGGTLQVDNDLKERVKNSYVVAADSGIAHAKHLGLMPDIWIGDFDSSTSEFFDEYQSVEKVPHSSNKNQSDGELALDLAIARKPQTITICGALGGKRTDHVLFILLGALKYALDNPDIAFYLTSGAETAFPLLPNRELALHCAPDTTFSVIPFSALTGLTVSGVKWPLQDENIALGSTHTLSNLSNGKTRIKLDDGYALALVQNKHSLGQ
ncbi:thiamine diphosphokinase [Ahrensia kielensis]|uniref:thiamine diphosphokinase n=1 Tax=Ahrensia kielensis TaxID=76980 RepID=UPI00035F6E0E|nr:thiamine diphosphokinase [Ahrensia kielensis]